MPKAPPNTPDRHDRVIARGKPARQGVMTKYDPETDWCTVAWDDAGGPKTCHRFELQKVSA